MVNRWQVILTRQAEKDAKNLASAGLRAKVEAIFKIMEENPYSPLHHFEKLSGDLSGYYSRRINKKHRMVYEILEKERLVRILRMWTHYE